MEQDKMEQDKYTSCKHHYIGTMQDVVQGRHFCIPDNAKTLGDAARMKQEIDPQQCRDCPRYKSRYISYPVTINKMDIENPEPYGVTLTPVAVRICGEDITRFGVYLGNFPRYTTVSLNEDTGTLKIRCADNACIFIPELKRVVFGDECFWRRLKDETDMKNITDEIIQNQWYMKLLNLNNDERK